MLQLDGHSFLGDYWNKLNHCDFLFQAIVAVSSDSRQILPAVQCSQNGAQPSWSPLSDWKTHTRRVDIPRICCVQRRTSISGISYQLPNRQARHGVQKICVSQAGRLKLLLFPSPCTVSNCCIHHVSCACIGSNYIVVSMVLTVLHTTMMKVSE